MLAKGAVGVVAEDLRTLAEVLQVQLAHTALLADDVAVSGAKVACPLVRHRPVVLGDRPAKSMPKCGGSIRFSTY